MNRICTLATASLLAATGFVSNASAQSAIRTFVKTSGSDSSPCTFAAPCRTLQPAINAVGFDGEVIVLDSGAFGSDLIINKSVTISADPAVTARIRVNTVGITVDGSGISVRINGIGISGPGYGIIFQRGSSLVLRNVEIDLGRNNVVGVWHRAPGGVLSMTDSVVTQVVECITIESSSSTAVRATLTNVNLVGCRRGVGVISTAFVAIDRSTITGVDHASCSANVRALNGGNVTIDNSTISHCQYGLLSTGSGSVLSVSNSLLTFNVIPGATETGGLAQTSGNNRVLTNSSNALPGFTSVPTQ